MTENLVGKWREYVEFAKENGMEVAKSHLTPEVVAGMVLDDVTRCPRRALWRLNLMPAKSHPVVVGAINIVIALI